MPNQSSLGELEHLVLLAVLRLSGTGGALEIRKLLAEDADRAVSRGALYTTLERLETKGFVSWTTDVAGPERGGIPKRRFSVTEEGVVAVRTSQAAILRLSAGLTELRG